MGNLIIVIAVCALVLMVIIETAIISMALDISAILKEIKRRRDDDE